MTPYSQGVRIHDHIITPDAFTDKQLAEIMYRLTADADDAALLLESCTPEEADYMLNPGVTLIAEAVTAVKNRLDRTMSALVRVFARHGDKVKPYEFPSIGPDRKNALFAYKTSTFTFDDGQTVSILFHSPGRDPMKLAADDTLIAYRWMLNRRDITAIVSPERGRDINLQTMARRIMQLVEENSEQFQANNEKRQEQNEKLSTLEAEQAEESIAVDRLTQQNADLSGQIESTDERIERLRARLAVHGEGDREGSGPEPDAPDDETSVSAFDENGRITVDSALTALMAALRKDTAIQSEARQTRAPNVTDAERLAYKFYNETGEGIITKPAEDGPVEIGQKLRLDETRQLKDKFNAQAVEYLTGLMQEGVAPDDQDDLAPLPGDESADTSTSIDPEPGSSDRVADYLSRIEQAETAKDVGAIGIEIENDTSLSADENLVMHKAVREARIRFSQQEEAERQAQNSPEQIDTADGWQVSHGPFVDFTLTAQAALGVDSTRVSVKARNGITIGSIERDDVNAFTGGDTSTFTPADNWKTTYSEELKQLMGLASPESTPAQEPDSLEAIDSRLYRDISNSIRVIRGIDNGTEQGYNRSLFVSSISNKLKTQARNGNEDVVDAALLLIAQQGIEHGKPILAKRNAMWSITGNDMDYYVEIAQRQASAAPATSEDEPAPAQPSSEVFASGKYRDDLVLLHGTKVEAFVAGKSKEGYVNNKYSQSDLDSGKTVSIRIGPFQSKRQGHGNFEVPPADIVRIIEQSGWESDYLDTTPASGDEPAPTPGEQDDTPAPTEPEPESTEPTEEDRIGAALQALLSETDSAAAIDALEALMDEAEAAGIDIDNDPNMLAASDHITQLLEQEAA